MVPDPTKRKVIVAVSGDSSDYSPFSVPEADLFSDTLYFTDRSSLNKRTSVVSVGKYLKNNAKDLPNPPSDFNTDAKIKKLKVASFPLILPIVKGLESTIFKCQRLWTPQHL